MATIKSICRAARKAIFILLGAGLLNAAHADLAIYVVPAVTDVKILPQTPLPDYFLANTITVYACRGEYEPASFVLNSTAAVTGLTVTVGDLYGSGAGGAINGANVDIRVVKCWYQAGYGHADRSHRHLTPELLLKDDSMVKVEGTHNYLKKITGEYVWISEANTNNSGVSSIATNVLPIQDAASLQPVNLSAGSNQQFWVTVKVPADTIPGAYTGAIHLSGGGGIDEDLTLRVIVPDITLAPSYMDYSMYYTARLKNAGTISSLDKSETQFRAELTNMLAHGINNPNVYAQDSDARLASVLNIRNQTGMDNDNLFYLGLFIHSYGDNLTALTNRYKALAALAAPYGVNQLYIYGRDEQNLNNSTNRAQISALHDAGGKAFCAQMVNGDAQEIAALTGWANQLYFSTAFHKHYGYAPSACQRRRKIT